jgi:sugar phosphate permease
VLTRIVVWWSAFTALTGTLPDFTYIVVFASLPVVVNSLMLMVLVRFWFGAGEAGAIPNAARILLHWFPGAERGRVQGLFQGSMHVGGAIAPILAAEIIEVAGWRWTFVIFGFAGVVWASLFYWWFRDKPAEHGAVNAAELQWIGRNDDDAHGHGAVPWSEAASNPNVWLLSVTIIMSAFNSYFFFSWYSTYLQEGRGVDNVLAGRLSGVALLGATAGSLVGGALADWITRHVNNRYRARRLLCLFAFFTAAALLYDSVLVDNPIVSALYCGFACLAMFCHLPTWWGCAFDVSGKHTGAIFGLLNGVGVVGAIGAQYFWGAFADWRKSAGFSGREQWDPAFYVSIGFLVVAGILWQFIYPSRAIGEPDVPG